MALPVGLAYGVVSGAGPMAGLLCGVVTGLGVAVFGGTPTQISGPTGPMAIVMAGLFSQFADRPEVAFTAVMLAGVMQILLGTLHWGRYLGMLPYPVIAGYSAAVGAIILIMQLAPTLGHPGTHDIHSALRALPSELASPSPQAIGLCLGTLALCRLTPARLNRIVPRLLLVLIAGSLFCLWTNLPVATLADAGGAGWQLHLPVFERQQWQTVVVGAGVIALMSSIDSLVTSLAADNATHRFHDANQELVGQGVGNLLAGLLGAIPGAGATSRTLENIHEGGRTPLSAVIHSVILLAAMLTLGGLFRYIPRPVLAGVLIYVALSIIDWRFLKRLLFAPVSARIIALATLVVSVLDSIISGVAVGVVLASLLLVKRTADQQIAGIQMYSDTSEDSPLSDEEAQYLARCHGRALLIRLTGPLSFGAANGMTRKLAGITQYEAVVLDLSDVPDMDESATLALEHILRRAKDNNEPVLLAGTRPQVARQFVRFGIVPLVRETERFSRRVDALRYAATLLNPDEPGDDAKTAGGHTDDQGDHTA